MTGSVIPNATLPLVFREANGFLPKPFGLVELYRAVASCLGSKVMDSNFCNNKPCGSAEAIPP